MFQYGYKPGDVSRKHYDQTIFPCRHPRKFPECSNIYHILGELFLSYLVYHCSRRPKLDELNMGSVFRFTLCSLVNLHSAQGNSKEPHCREWLHPDIQDRAPITGLQAVQTPDRDYKHIGSSTATAPQQPVYISYLYSSLIINHFSFFIVA